MTEMVFNLDLYQIPSERILRNRRVFYNLWRRSDDKTTAWLNRVQNCICHCEFPKIILEFLLFDRFVCELNSTELGSIQNVNESWTLKQLLEHFSDENVVSGDEHIESSSAMEDENTSLGVVKSEPNEEKWIQIGLPIQSSDEADPLAELKPDIIEDEHTSVDENVSCKTDETHSLQTLNEGEIDHDMLNNAMQFESEDQKFSIEDAATVTVDKIVEDIGKNHLEEEKGGDREQPYASKATKIAQNLQQHLNSHTGENPFPCDQCDKAFTQLRNLNSHKRTIHQRIRPHACEQCGKHFARPSELKTHSSTHTGERPYACDECNKLYATPNYLSAHKRIVHRGIRAHVCIECGKRCITPAELKYHMNIHTGEKPFACDQCDKAFTQPGALKSHHRTVHQRIRPHACEQCGKHFASAHNLKRHLVIHLEERSTYSCDECDKSFAHSDSLTKHIRIVHRELRSYVCEQCGKCFKERSDFKLHFRIHIRAKSFSCDECDKVFNYCSNLKSHKMTVHQGTHPHALPQCDELFA